MRPGRSGLESVEMYGLEVRLGSLGLYLVLTGPLLDFTQEAKRSFAKLCNVITDCQWPFGNYRARNQLVLLHLFEALIDHVLARGPHLAREIIKPKRPIFQMP